MPSPSQLPVINAAGKMRKLAALAPLPEHIKGVRSFRDVHPKIDPSTWQDCDYSFYGSPIRDQGTHGSCTGHAGVTCFDVVDRMQGQTPELLSCTFPYGLVNGGRDDGASVSSVLQVLKQVGTCTFAEVGTDMIYQSQFPRSAWDTAKKYQVAEYLICSSFEELCEAINRGYPVAFGIAVGQNFSRMSPDGICPTPDITVGGHALCGLGIKKYRDGVWIIKFQNSWSKQWGLNGYAYLTRGHFDNMVDGYAIMHDKLDDTHPIVTKTKTKRKTKDPDPTTDVKLPE